MVLGRFFPTAMDLIVSVVVFPSRVIIIGLLTNSYSYFFTIQNYRGTYFF